MRLWNSRKAGFIYFCAVSTVSELAKAGFVFYALHAMLSFTVVERIGTAKARMSALVEFLPSKVVERFDRERGKIDSCAV